jgi:hypothetical protein
MHEQIKPIKNNLFIAGYTSLSNNIIMESAKNNIAIFVLA